MFKFTNRSDMATRKLQVARPRFEQLRGCGRRCQMRRLCRRSQHGRRCRSPRSWATLVTFCLCKLCKKQNLKTSPLLLLLLFQFFFSLLILLRNLLALDYWHLLVVYIALLESLPFAVELSRMSLDVLNPAPFWTSPRNLWHDSKQGPLSAPQLSEWLHLRGLRTIDIYRPL